MKMRKLACIIAMFLFMLIGMVSADYNITFYFYDANTSAPLNNVTVDYGVNSTVLDSGGSILLPAGDYTFNISKTDYVNRNLEVTINNNLTITAYLIRTNVSSNTTALPSLAQPTVPQELKGYVPNITDLNTEISELFVGPTGWALAVIFVLSLAVASLKFHQKPAVTAAVVGTSIVYLGTWVAANWGVLWVLIAMLLSATMLRIFGRYQK